MRWQLENFEFDQQKNLLTGPNGQERLEPKTAALLSFFIAHNGKDISRDDLIASVWHGQIVSDHAINRAVLNLRKALGDTEKAKRFIITIPKVGYRFVCKAQEVQATVVVAPSRAANRFSVFHLSIAAVLVLIIGFVVYQISQPTPQSESIQVSPLVRLDGIQFDVEQSNNGEMLAYSRRVDNQPAEIHLLKKGEAAPEIISQQGGDASLSHWAPDDNRLVYKYTAPGTCQLHMVEFQVAIPQAPKPIYECTSGPNLKALAFNRDGTKLFFTERAHRYAPFILYELDLDNDSKRRLPQPLPSGIGNYHIDTNPHTGHLLLVANQTSEHSSIFEVNLADSTYSKLLDMDYELLAAIWNHDGTGIIHSGPHPSHHLIETLFGGSSRILVPGSRRIGGMKRLSNGRDYLFGSYLSNHNITVNGKDFLSLNSSDMDYLPTYSRSGEQLAFISRRTGDDMLWIKDLNSENLSSVELPHVSHSFISIDWANDDAHILINSSRGIIIVDLAAGKTIKTLETAKPARAATWADASSIFHSQYSENRWHLYRQNIFTGQRDSLSAQWAFAFSEQDHTLYIDQNMQAFLNATTAINTAECSSPLHNSILTYRLSGQNLYCLDKNNQTQLRLLSDMQTSTLLNTHVGPMRYYSISNGNIATSRFVQKTSDIMRTTITANTH
ncbi:winged helix-turn-helix domain-containing protein [Kordiimonas sp. SCSIO 12603]|uniref:winged helix-turn-helix domain-containing protein n=1 Tax=Kordiimonas sp. SCSIO 12603 TaxID=2829596 RepID=UPI002107C666|nr:winged helix-turn-helix domain-containing protein [Kordiimonas sp. SCSIO 12603]UTW59393.1 winged helix-turn-helix domain-containing protein [Kordiimonas sp. SCSIO 12603]